MSNQVFETVTAEFSMTGRTGTEQVFNTGTRQNVTPPEYKVLERIHKKANVRVVEKTGPALERAGVDGEGKPKFRPRTADEEIDRLRNWYGEKEVQKVYPNENPDLPYTFAEARIPVKLPDNVRALGGRKKAGEAETEGEADGVNAAISK